MNKIAFDTASGFGLPVDGISRVFALFAGLMAGPAARKAVAPAILDIARGFTRYSAKPLGRLVTCTAGAVWLTFDAEPQDIVLEAGEFHRCESASRLSIHAMSDATVRLV